MVARIRVAVVDDHPLFREGVTRSLSEIDGFEIVAEGSSKDDAIEIAQSLGPDVMLMDISMPGSKCIGEYPFGMFPFVLGRHPAQPMEKLASRFSAIRCDGERQLYIFSIRRGNIRSCSFNRLTEAA